MDATIPEHSAPALEQWKGAQSTGRRVGSGGCLGQGRMHTTARALEHALAVRAMYGRQRYHNLCCEDYASIQTNYAATPYVVAAGSPLQFPTVPAVSSLFAEPEGQTKEYRIGQAMLADQDYACEVKPTMRF